MAEKVVSRLEELQKKLGLLKKATDSKRKAKKKAKKTEKRKFKKSKHQKQKARKQETKKLKRQRLGELKLKKLRTKEEKKKKHRMRKREIRKRKMTIKETRKAKKAERPPTFMAPKESDTTDERFELPEDRESPEPQRLPEREESPEVDKADIDLENLENLETPENQENNSSKENNEKKENKEEGVEEEAKEVAEEEVEEDVIEEAAKEKPKKAEEEPTKRRSEKKPLLPFKIKVNLHGKKKKKRDLRTILKERATKEAKRNGKSPTEVSHEMIKQLIVADVMSTDPINVNTDDKLSYVVRLFSSKKISGAPVISDHTITGIITKSDIIKVIGVKDLLNIDTAGLDKLEDYKVSDVMRKKVHFVTRYTKVSDAADIMNKNDINLLPVVDDKKRVIGVVSRGDIVRVVSKELLTKMVQERRQAANRMVKIETDIDSVLELVEKEGSINIFSVKEKLGVSEDRVEDWAKILEKEGLIEIYYPAFGSPVLRKKLRKEAKMFEEEENQ